MVAIIDLQLVAYGNTAYDSDSGEFTCQHGEGECSSDTYESCVEYKLSGDIGSIEKGDTALAAWPFILCMEQAEGDPTQAQTCYESNMNTTALPWSTVNSCYNNEAEVVQTAAMKATPTHDYVPWVTVNGELLQHTGLLQKAICDAYTGTPPESCRGPGLTAIAEKDVGRCYRGEGKHTHP
jgi:hypothetical protein